MDRVSLGRGRRQEPRRWTARRSEPGDGPTLRVKPTEEDGARAVEQLGGAFPDRASALRLVTAVALNVTAIWTDRRYLDMSLLRAKEVVVAKAA